MRRFWLLAIVGVVILSGLLVRGLPSGWSGPIPTPARPPAPAGPAGLLSGLPLAFVPGDGPGAPGYYTARTTGGSLAFTPAGVRLALAEPAAPGCGSQGRPLRRAGGRAAVPCAAPAGGGHQAALAPPPAIQLQWAGANPQPALQAGAALPGRVSSFRGADATHWRPGVATYGTLTYQGLYPGIDLTYTGTGRVLKGTYTVAPGAAPTAIRWRYAGAQQVTLDAAGNLQIQVGGRTLVEVAPVAWQELGGRRVPVSVRYQLDATGQAGFVLGRYDATRPLILDPALLYASYLGGSNDDSGWGIALDAAGDIYIAGITTSFDFPTTAAYQPNAQGGDDAFVAKLDPTGSTLLYATYLGGQGNDGAYGIAVDSAGTAYLTGYTTSPDFPLQAAIQPTFHGPDEAFVTALSPDGTALVYSTYLGGDGINEGWALAIDTAGSAYVTGVTTATNFPLHNPYQAAYGGGTFDGFVTKIISTTGVYTYAYSTYLGGAGDDEGWAIKVDSLGDAVLTGLTASPDFPRLNAYQPAYGGGPADAFLTSIRPDGTALLYSTYLGGVGDDEGYGLALDPAGGAVLTGVTSSPNFPTAPPAPIQAALRGPTDAFVTRFRPDGSQPVYSTYLGGDLTDAGWAVAVDSSGAAYVTGTTDSDNFPLQNATQANAGSEGDAFIAAVSPAGDALTYATYLGGEDYEVGTAIVVDNSQHLDLAGFTYSTAFPIAGPAPLQDLNRGESNAFVARIDLAAPVPPSPGPGGVDTGAGDQQAPAADGAFAVWEDNSGGTWDIRAKNLDTGQLYWVYQGPGDQRRPAASGDLVVWQDNRNGNWAIYAARFQQGAFSGPTPVALGPGDQIKPAVDHDLVLWQSSAAVLATTTPEDAVRWDVVGRVMSQTVSQPFTLTTAGTTNTNPAIGVAIPGGGRSGQPVLSLGAWQSRPYPPPPNSNWQINGAVAVESTPIPFAVPDGGRSRINPVVNGLDIIWQVSPPTPGAGPISGSGWDVGGGHGSTGLAPGVLPRTGNGAPGPGGPHPPAFGITVFTITTGLAAEPDPRLSDNNVVWQDYDPLQGAWAIKQTDIVTGTPFAVVAGLTAVPHPAISGPRVVWQETDPSTGNDVHGNVCGLNGQMCSPTPTAPPTQTALPSRTATATPTAIAFSDVHPSDYFYPAVEYLAARGVISGYADGTFRPYNQTTRAQMVKIVVLGFAKPISTPAGGGYTFADVPPTFPFFAVIETAAADQIVSGYNCGGPGEPCDTLNRPYFRPYANVTRGQLAKIDVVAAGWPLLNPPAGSFADVLPQTAFYTFVETAYCHGIISGYACGGPGEPCDNTNRPYARQYNPATRGQIAKIVYLSVTGAPACGGAP